MAGRTQRTRLWAAAGLIGGWLVNGAVAAGGDPFQLSMPVACEIGRDCFIQSYVDVEPGPEVTDFACGSATYEGHDGTDIRLVSAEAARAGTAVLAAAPGVVKGLRDGMADIFADDKIRPAIAGRECGNGVVLDHGNGWETQYCHMRSGSVTVEKGARVERGTKLGEVGYSGLAQFAHLHMTVRNNGKPVDPFTGSGRNGECLRDPSAAHGLWDDSFRSRFRYAPGEIIAAGFSGRVPKLEDAEADGAARVAHVLSPELVFFARFINLKAGDRLRFTVSGPGGFDVRSESEPLDRNKAHYLAFAGKKLKADRWPVGRYEGIAQIVRAGMVVGEQKVDLTLE